MLNWLKPFKAAGGRKRRAVPTILQIEAVECGAASLAMVLAYFGAWIPLEQIRTACGVSRDGAKASNILKAARSFGVNAKGYKKEPANLGDLPWPLIVHWNFNHFLVVEGMSRSAVYLNDPASGRRAVSMQEFSDGFTGVALAFDASDTFRKTRRPSGLLTAFRERIAGSRATVLLIVLLSVTLIVPGIALPVFAKLFVDGILLNQQEHWVAPLFVAFAATALLRAALVHVRQSLMLRLEVKLAIVGASRFLWHVMHLPMGFFTQRPAGEIAARVDASQRVAKVISTDMANTVIDSGMVIIFALVMTGYDPVLGLTAICLGLPNIALLRYAQSTLASASRLQAAELGKLAAATVGIIQNIETTKASGLENTAFARWAGYHAKTLDAARSLGLVSTFVALGPTLMKGMIQVAILGLGAYRVISGALTVGDLVAFQSLAESFADPLRRVVGLSPTLNGIKADLNRVDDAMRNRIESSAETAGRPDMAAHRGEISITGLTYGYNPLEPPLLDNINLQVAPGQRIALVGRSGCGKSTLGRLICGLLTPWSGEVRIDDIPITSLANEHRAASIGYVDQDIFLFEGTVRDNLTLWNREVPDSAVTRALNDAAMLDEIVGRAGEISAPVEEGGRNFSGGQRQRLEIARALVASPALLVLDEATGALDSQTEKVIDDNLRRRGCTCIIIAHRLSTIRDCSEIIVMQKGRIVERGTHDSLLAQRGEYADLIRTT